MERLAELQHRIGSLTELLDVVGTMRSLAAIRVREARAAVPGIRQYAAVVNEALAEAVPLLSDAHRQPGRGSDNTGFLVFCSEHGFVGAFNDHLLDAVAASFQAPDDRLLLIGSRGLALAGERGLPIAWTHPMATSRGGVIEVARRVAEQLYRGVAMGEFHRVVLLFAESRGGAEWHAVSRRLLPFDPSPYRPDDREGQPPLLNLPPELLLEKLVDEFVFAELMHAAMESFASENAARLAAMESAHRNIEERLDELRHRAWQRRQEEITMELLDVVTGAEAMAEAAED